MKAIILAAGYATRLYPLTKDKPKALLPINKKPIINYIINQIEEIPEIDEVFIVSNHKFYSHFEQWLQGENFKIKTKIINDGTTSEETRLGAIGDIRFVIEKENITDEIVVIAGDNLFTFSLKDYFNYFKEVNKDCVCIKQLDNKEAIKSMGVALVNSENLVLEIEEKPQHPKSDLAVYATYMYKKETIPLFKKYIDEGNKPDAPGYFASWLVERKEVCGFLFKEECYDVGTHESLEEVNTIFSKTAII